MSPASFFFNDTATTEIYTLSLHDALPIFMRPLVERAGALFDDLLAPLRIPSHPLALARFGARGVWSAEDRKSTRLNSSHANISYAVFCLKKKNQHTRVAAGLRYAQGDE